MKKETLKAWISKGEFSLAKKNLGKPSKRDIADDYGYIWFVKESIPNRRGMIAVEIRLSKPIK